MEDSYLYILASKRNGTLYIGATTDLVRRVFEHKHKFVKGFTNKYGVTSLVYYEAYSNIYDAMNREKQLKRWKRLWKPQLIEEFNPDWNDLYEDILG